MPYNILEKGQEFIVINSDTGEVKGKHKSRQEAVAHLRAMYAIEKNKESKSLDPEQKAPPPGHPFYGNQWVQFAGWAPPGSFGNLSLFTPHPKYLDPGQAVPKKPLTHLNIHTGTYSIDNIDADTMWQSSPGQIFAPPPPAPPPVIIPPIPGTSATYMTEVTKTTTQTVPPPQVFTGGVPVSMSVPMQLPPDQISKTDLRAKFTEDEYNAVRHWGGSGKDVRQLQSGTLQTGSQAYRDHVQKTADDWTDALLKSPVHQGMAWRGLHTLPNDVLFDWIHSGQIRLKCDQSGTKAQGVAKSFSGTSGNYGTAVWNIMQKSSRDLMNTTEWNGEHEVILMKGTKYKVHSWDYRKRDGSKIDLASLGFDTSKITTAKMPHEVAPGGIYIFNMTEI